MEFFFLNNFFVSLLCCLEFTFAVCTGEKGTLNGTFCRASTSVAVGVGMLQDQLLNAVYLVLS